MKFIHVITNHTPEEMDQIVSQFDKISYELMVDFYKSFSYVEYVTESGHMAMYALIREHSIEKLLQEYIKWEVDFSYADITKPVLFSKLKPQINNEQDNLQLQGIVEGFLEDFVDIDMVLDKISEDKGMQTLTEHEKRILHPTL